MLSCVFLVKSLDMLTKEKIIDSINKMPESFSMEESMERIILL
jgi:hypothetical protein